MIFVTVGTHEQPFNRLIQKIDKLKKDNIALEQRIAYLEQHGGGSGGGIPDYEGEGLIMTFEDGTQMTFEDDSIMIFEEYAGE